MIIKIYNILRIIFLILFLIFSIYASKFYQGSIYIFGMYCASFIWMVFFLTSRKSSYFEIFFSSYLFLGFWFKFIFSLIFYNGIVFESGQDNSRNIDDILIIGIFISFTCLFSSYVSKKKINNEISNNNIIINKYFFQTFYLNNRILILLLFILLIIVVSFLNFKFGIFQRGFITISETSYLINNFIFITINETSYLINNSIKWLLLFGLTTFSCFIIYTEILNKRKIYFFTIFIALFEIFMSFSSMLSRLFPINALSIIIPTYQQSIKLKERNDQKFLILIIIVLIFTVLSIYLVNHFRIENLNSMKDDWKNISQPNSDSQSNSNLQSKIENYNFQIPEKRLTSNKVTQFILINRWIGIDSLILVHNSKKLSFSLLYESLSESKKTNAENTFFEITFELSPDKINMPTQNKILKGNTLPGIISFLYYSGNLYFVLISLFLIIILFNFFEDFIKKITGSNIIFACFLSNTIATRLIHFGYAPKESYLFVISVILSVIVMFFLSKTKVYFFRRK